MRDCKFPPRTMNTAVFELEKGKDPTRDLGKEVRTNAHPSFLLFTIIRAPSLPYHKRKVKKDPTHPRIRTLPSQHKTKNAKIEKTL
jgi:hypothetical protein